MRWNNYQSASGSNGTRFPGRKHPGTRCLKTKKLTEYVEQREVFFTGISDEGIYNDGTAPTPPPASPASHIVPLVTDTLTLKRCMMFSRRWKSSKLQWWACLDLPGTTTTTRGPGLVEVGHNSAVGIMYYRTDKRKIRETFRVGRSISMRVADGSTG
jgi:hypothetical protein